MSSNLHTANPANTVDSRINGEVSLTEELNNQTIASPQAATPVEKSRGDKLFERWLYGGLNGVGTFIATIPLAYSAKYGKFKEPLENFGERLGRAGLGAKNVNTVTLMLATSLGGTAMLLPTWLAEHYRKPIVARLNGKPADQPPAPDAPAEYEAPKQTLGSLLRGRVLAMAAVTASFGVANHFFADAFKKFETNIGEKAVQWFAKNKSAAFTEKTKLYGEMAALDIFATAAASSILFVGSRFFANHRNPESAQLATQPTAEDLFIRAETVLKDAPAPSEPSTTISGEKQQAGVVRETGKETQLA